MLFQLVTLFFLRFPPPCCCLAGHAPS
ncbi:hypothetical protein J2W15_003968 [Pseudarthrobacter sulfonivorans]|nr:hypothetical protein [Pseudarthrobacter sulfonivorans]